MHVVKCLRILFIKTVLIRLLVVCIRDRNFQQIKVIPTLNEGSEVIQIVIIMMFLQTTCKMHSAVLF